MPPFLSVIIPCRNEAASVRRCVDAVLASNYPVDRMEVLVVDGRSADGSRETLANLALADARVRVLDNPELTTPWALNRAITAAKGEFVLRVDAHSTIAPDYAARLVTFLEGHPQIWGVGGAMTTVPEAPGPFAVAIATVLSHRFGVGNSNFRTGGPAAAHPVDTVFNCCWRRGVFAHVGLFHEALSRSQDIEMSERISRAGGALWLDPKAKTIYFARTRFGAYLRHNFTNGLWSILPAIYLGRLPVGWRHLVPLLFVLAVGGSAIFAATSVSLRWLPAIPLVPYVLANLYASLTSAWRCRDLRLAITLPLAFVGLHLAYGAGSVWGALRVAVHYLQPSQPQPVYHP